MFLYFYINKNDKVAALLENRLDGLPKAYNVCEGPGGVRGNICGTSKRMGYYPDEQVWQEFDNGNLWIGYWKDKKPTPAELKRDQVIDGHLIKLADGNDWLIPIARVWEGHSVLPKSLGIGPDGSLVEKPLQKYIEASKMAQEIWECQVEGTVKITYFDLFKKVCLFVNFNYRIGVEEATILQLMPVDEVERVSGAIIDLPALEEAIENAKKNESESVSDGSPD